MNKIQPIHDHKLVDFWGFLSSRADILTGALAGLMIGLLIVGVRPTFTLIVLFVLVYVVILIQTPEIAILLLLLLTSGLLPKQFNPYFNLLVGHFQVSDLILVSLLVLLVMRALVEKDFHLRKSPLNLPLILFFLAVCIGMITAVVEHGIKFSDTTYEARILLYYALFFAAANLIRTRQQAYRLVFGIFTIGILVASQIILQVVFGISFPFILPSYIKADLLARSYHPGLSAVFLTMMALICILTLQKSRMKMTMIWLALFILGIGNIASLGRNIVVSTLVSLIVLLFLLDKPQRTRWTRNFAFLIIIALGAFGLLQILSPSATVLEYPKALVERFTHFFTTDIMSPDETILWRVREIQYAWEKIVESPLFGIGFKTQYRPSFSEADTLQSFIHNAYLWIWLKTGLIGLTPFLWFLLTFIVSGMHRWENIQDEFLRVISLGFVLGILALMFSDLVAPLLVQGFNLAFFSASMGLFEAAIALEKKAT
ncbi:MAG: O-antigen ligase family protein [Chloroflexi bacterium]|nr:O-antigen ligase family protein [Chloroflexota bacterium]